MVKERATLAGGCFWCLEPIFTELKGVLSVVPGYSGGETTNPTYKEVSTGKTGHAEAVQITFDPQIITFRDLLKVFFSVHDPTTLNRQGADIGTQYRSAIFYHTDKQKEIAEEVIRELGEKNLWENEIVTELSPLEEFYPAEEYHYNYFERNPGQPYCRMVIAPKVAKFRKKFINKLQER